MVPVQTMLRAVISLSVATALVACGGVPQAPTPSPHFETVAEHLRLGGTVYGYADVEGDPEKVAALLIELLDDFPAIGSGLRDIGPEELAKILGLHNVKAFGYSSYADQDLFHNQAFIHHEGERSGLMKVFGGTPRPFTSLSLAPKDTDMVYEREIDLKSIMDIVKALSQRGVGISPAFLGAMLKAPAFGLPVTFEQLIERLDTRIVAVVKLHDDRQVKIPGSRIMLPFAELIVKVDGLGVIVDALAESLAEEKYPTVIDDEQWFGFSRKAPLPAPWNAYDLQLRKDKATDGLWLVSSPAFLETCLSGSSSVTTATDYQRAMRDAPVDGNGLTYLSPLFTRALSSFVDQLPKLSRSAGSFAPLLKVFLPQADLPMGSVVKNLPHGMLYVSNSSSSHKTTILAGAWANPVTLAIAAAILIPSLTDQPRMPPLEPRPFPEPSIPGEP